MFQALPPHIEMRNQLDITCKSELRAEVYTQTRNEFCSSMDIFPRQEGQVVPPDSELALGRPDILTFSIEYCAFGSRLRDDDDSETSEDASDSEDSAPTASSPKTPPVVGDNDPDIKAEPTPPRPARTSDEAVRLETLEKK